VSLAAAKVGLKIDHRVAALARQAPHGTCKQLAQAVGEEGAPVELDRIGVLGARLALVHPG
jgi:hypothetical protein